MVFVVGMGIGALVYVLYIGFDFVGNALHQIHGTLKEMDAHARRHNT